MKPKNTTLNKTRVTATEARRTETDRRTRFFAVVFCTTVASDNHGDSLQKMKRDRFLVKWGVGARQLGEF